MSFYEILIYINEEEINSEIKSYLKQLLKKEEQISLKKDWLNGYHIKLFGRMKPQKAERIYLELFNLIKKYPSVEYNVDDFIKKYDKVSKYLGKNISSKNILQNRVIKKEIDHKYGFQSLKQFELYINIHKVFDKYYVENYLERNIDILRITKDVFPFFQSLPEKVISKQNNGNIISSGYISHLSHFIGFLYSLKKNDQEKIKKTFDQGLDSDIKSIINSYYINDITSDLIKVYSNLATLVDQGEVNFFSPKSEEQFMDTVKKSSPRHKQVYRQENNKLLVLNDKVSITNRWILNVLYEKLVLLNIKPIDKFYMNYLLSKIRYTNEEIGGAI